MGGLTIHLRNCTVILIVYRWERALASNDSADRVRGALDTLVIHRLVRAPGTATGIDERVKKLSHDVLRVWETSLTPVLQRLRLDAYGSTIGSLIHNLILDA